MALASLASPLTSLANTTLGVINGGQRVVCSEFYGAFPYSFDCKDAIRKMPSGDAAIPYTINSGYVPSKRLPQYSKAGPSLRKQSSA